MTFETTFFEAAEDALSAAGLPDKPEDTSASSGFLSDGRFFCKLKKPIEVTTRSATGSKESVEEISIVVLKVPVTKDLRVTDRHDGDVAKTIALIAQLSGLSSTAIDKLHPKDFRILAEATGDF